jgi:hypothetical protein
VDPISLAGLLIGIIGLPIAVWQIMKARSSDRKLDAALAALPSQVCEALNSQAPENPRAANPADWQIYINHRFGFLVRFPPDWHKGMESDNGDGVPLYLGDPDNEILAYGAIHHLHSQPYRNLGRPNFKHHRFQLLDGREASLILGKEDNKVIFEIIVLVSDIEYHFYANVTSNFFQTNRDILLRVARSLEAHPERSIYGPQLQ